MTRYIIRRSLQSLVLIWISTLIGFSIYQMAPGGPLQFLDDDPRRTQADVQRLERVYGIDRTITVQYIAWAFGRGLVAADRLLAQRALSEQRGGLLAAASCGWTSGARSPSRARR